MNITEKDTEFFRYLHASKVSTYKRIHRDIYPEYNFKSVCNKMAKMEKHGFISGVHNRIQICGEKVVCMSKKGFQHFLKRNTEERIELSSEAIFHDLKLVDLKHHLLQSPKVTHYFTENQLQTWGKSDFNEVLSPFVHLNSDAVVQVNFNKGSVWVMVEFENSEKALERYEPLLRKYYQCDDVTLVLYACQKLNTIEKVSQLEKKLFSSEQPKFFYQLMQKIEQDEVVSFFNCHNQRIELAKKSPYGDPMGDHRASSI